MVDGTGNLPCRRIPECRYRMPFYVFATEMLTPNIKTPEGMNQAMKLCGKFLFSTLHRALHLKNLGQEVFVATGDFDSM